MLIAQKLWRTLCVILGIALVGAAIVLVDKNIQDREFLIEQHEMRRSVAGDPSYQAYLRDLPVLPPVENPKTLNVIAATAVAVLLLAIVSAIGNWWIGWLFEKPKDQAVSTSPPAVQSPPAPSHHDARSPR